MISLEDVLTPGRTVIDMPGVSKKRVLEQIATLLSRDLVELDALQVFEALIAREKLGSTGFGNGIAIPHCRLAGCTQPTAALIRLDHPVDFDSPDNQPVDLLFTLVVPAEATDTHLELLRQIASLLENPETLRHLREAGSSEALYQFAVSSLATEG